MFRHLIELQKLYQQLLFCPHILMRLSSFRDSDCEPLLLTLLLMRDKLTMTFTMFMFHKPHSQWSVCLANICLFTGAV